MNESAEVANGLNQTNIQNVGCEIFGDGIYIT